MRGVNNKVMEEVEQFNLDDDRHRKLTKKSITEIRGKGIKKKIFNRINTEMDEEIIKGAFEKRRMEGLK